MEWKVRKVGFVPGKASDKDKYREQDEFVEMKLKPCLDEAGECTVFFVDAAHFVHVAFLAIQAKLLNSLN